MHFRSSQWLALVARNCGQHDSRCWHLEKKFDRGLQRMYKLRDFRLEKLVLNRRK